LAAGPADSQGLPNASGHVPAGTLAGDVVLPTLMGLEPGVHPGEVLPPAIHDYLGVNGAAGDHLVFDLLNVPGQAPQGTLAGDVVLPTLMGLDPGVHPGEVLPPAIHEYLFDDGPGGGHGLLAGAFLALGDGADEFPAATGFDALLAGDSFAFTGAATANPEPATLGLLALGGLALLRRRK